MQVRDIQKPMEPFNLVGWIERNKHRLIPPVSNETIYKGNDNFIVMVSGGPNTRKDYHYNESEELFYQVKGDIKIKLFIDGQHKTIDLREGEMVLIPPKVPHSPWRFANTAGLIIEKHRVKGEKDGFLYFCEKCGNLLYEEYFFLEDIVKQFPMVMRNFYGSLERRTCKKCGTVMELPLNWDENIAVRAQENEYAKDPLAPVRGRSW
ncbi:MAG: 3-hydroxyanthranilate 3,4-dioxygenase [Candidatus Fraserbacteria bacterium RBG_16_55_9]|uniref:3-hydroxyanthranilate 3,4-dioxygenase n=1 Tax=Fraserbacteria sp. (strain RBG_16_55_9) TaxID=1817864 RepID=A0A1F5V0E4_FRAXR|nr:MAG: 3-hydroxyanthranilate 3,4-dioxygenase [Candidatus Fraserbacteria bacterium RBG_16_55_9]